MTYFKYLAMGAALGLVVLLILATIPRRAELYFLALFLAATAASYAGAPLPSAGSAVSHAWRLYSSLLCSRPHSRDCWSPLWLAVGYAAHAVWDLFHHPRRVGAEMVHWFPLLCLSFDLVIAIFIGVEFLAAKKYSP